MGSQFRSNWFISVGGGVQVFMGDHDRQRSFGQRLSPALNFSVGKWFTPGIGLELSYSGLSAKGATQNGVFSTGEPLDNKPWHGYWLNKSKFDFMQVHVDVLFDMCNLIGGYNPNRVYSMVAYAGGGYARTWSKPHRDGITGMVGLRNVFHVSRAFDVNIDARISAFDDNFDGANGDAVFDGMVSLTAGITYRFAPRGFKTGHEIVTVYEYDNDAVNALRAQVNDLVAQNEKLEREKGNQVVHNVVEYVGGNYIIYFPINVSNLSLEDRAQLEMCANAIKTAPEGTRFNIVGYADAATGTASINEVLSRTRAENVRACLVNEFGVDPRVLEVSWKGGVGNMFYDSPKLSRVVIISPIE